ncbi:MAG: hypothetical protein K2J82_09040, partial [Muribaculaceae bacterium]|nr:hypothetical protein [Muribaculaceae bacterium]
VEVDRLEAEGNIESTVKVDGSDLKDFWLFIYNADKADDDARDYNYHKAINISALDNLPSLKEDGVTPAWSGAVATLTPTDDTSTVNVPLLPGEYKVYLVANVHEYLGTTRLFTKDTDGNYLPVKESVLKATVLNFADKINDSSSILLPGHLPMVCLASDVNEAKNEKFNVLDNDLKELHCNLNFLCAKVRYTVLFDNTKDSGFSSTNGGQFTSTDFLDIDGATISQLGNSTKFADAAAADNLSGTYSIPLNKVYYPANGTSYPAGKDENNVVENADNKLSNLATTDFTATQAKRAWQGVVYLPENLNNSSDKLTTIDFDSKVGSFSNPYSVKLFEGANEQSDKEIVPLQRGKFYDLVLQAKSRTETEITFTVDDWNTEILEYDLRGPYYLQVGATTVKVTAGEPSYLWYDSDVTVKGVSPEITKNGKSYEIYDITCKNGEATIKVNTDIDSQWFDEIMNDSKYHYFHLKAGKLYKRIEISPLELKRFMEADPLDFTINVGQEIASDHYDGSVKVTVETNIEYFTLSDINFGSDAIVIKDEKGSIINNGVKCYPKEGKFDLYVYFSGLNDGLPFWTSNKDFTFKINPDNTSGGVTSKTVSVHTKSANDNYIIHFKGDDFKWLGKNDKDTDLGNEQLPHIYVYQCLELPAYLEGYKDGKKLASMPVGYNVYQPTAALEYSFTGKIAFKGWDDGDSNTKGTNKNSIEHQLNNNTTLQKGFFFFDDAYHDHTKDYGNNGDGMNVSWNASIGLSDKRYYKNRDLCPEHRARIKAQNKCAECASGSGPSALWPGIIMEYEGDGWWKFELSGIATPGKALIMITNGHGWNIGQDRIPGSDEVGIPLFDFTGKEGWYVANKIGDGEEETTDHKRKSYRKIFSGEFVSKKPD